MRGEQGGRGVPLTARAQYWLWRAATAIVTRLPLGVSYRVAWVVGSSGYYLWPGGRRSMHRNFRRVLPRASPAQIRRVARRSMVNYCCYLADFIRFPALSPEQLSHVFGSHSSFADLDHALRDGKGAVIACMHFGNWDLAAGATAARGYPVTVVAESFADPRLDRLVAGARERLGMRVIKLERTGPSLVRALHRNGLLALLVDRPVPGEGVRVRFFGEEVEVPAGPARIALRTGARVVAAGFPRTAAGRMEVDTMTDFEIAVTTGQPEEDVRNLTQAIMDAHERFIRQYPDQWYMFREMWPRRR
ncbi:MAG: hypothetical protein C0506_02465 [Anaerolinea sp.]|nr:hypothetical protein [Anaerolinea sp.]